VLELRDLPDVNASLNALAAVLLVTGFVAIRRGKVTLHKRCMLTAFATSTLFLASYLTHKIAGGHTPFTAQGPVRRIYFVILISHIVLAAAILPLALTTLTFALRGRFDRHKRLARITWPIWLYVSVTGVVIWWMLYSGTFQPVS